MKPTTIEFPSSKKLGDYEEIWLAGGCFWGTEEYLSRLEGVLATAAGYANGTLENPTYEAVCTGSTGFAEAVYLQFDPARISLAFLLQVYYKSVNPHLLNRQGNDIGTQYRTGIYTTNPTHQKIIEESLHTLQQEISEPVVIEALPLENFYLAEEFHQEYLKKHPGGYCHIPSSLFTYAETAREYSIKSKEELKETLTPLQYHVTQEDGTEPPFQNTYDQEFRPGIYVSITTGEPLFVSADKFDAGCGWPAFSRPLSEVLLTEHVDTSHGRMRTEVRSRHGNDHLGHVFEDGPKELGGLRYCINSASLRFIPKENMEEEGYQAYLSLL